ncbi:MAG TPA: Manganese transport system ATP-binding protein MntB [Hyphomicrobiaceae bacterium MAG_BT-2024]
MLINVALNLTARDERAMNNYNRSKSALTVLDLTVSYSGKTALFSVDANFPIESMSAIIGPNGAGKSSFLKAVLNITPSLSGKVKIFDMSLKQAREHIAYVPQRTSIDWDFPASVLDVVKMGLYRELGLFGWLTTAHLKAAYEALDRVGMANLANRQIGQLSGGQQQRVFLARALIQNAKLYLLDEPFAGVDAATERIMIDVLKELKTNCKSIICVHHDLATVRSYFDHVFFINIEKVAEGPTASTFTPENLRTTYGERLAATHIEQLHPDASVITA